MKTNDFQDWLSESNRGDIVVYYEGCLSVDCFDYEGRKKIEVCLLRISTHLAADSGLVHLFQRRPLMTPGMQNFFGFEYIAVRC